MAPCRVPLPHNSHQLFSTHLLLPLLLLPYLFLINCGLADGAATQASSAAQQHQVSTPTTSTSQQHHAAATQVQQVSSSKPRVNVSKVCEQTGIHVTVRTSRPFFGLIHAKDKRRKSACAIEGAGQQLFTMDFEYATPEEENYCGLVVQRVPVQQPHQESQQIDLSGAADRRLMSLILVVRLHKTIESSEDQFFLLSCASSSLPLTTEINHNQQKSDCSNNYTSNYSTLGDDQLKGAHYKLSTRDDHRWHDPLLSGKRPQLELRYQWLVHVSCTLAALLAITLCFALWLCATRYTRSQHNKPNRESPSKQILYTTSQSSDKSTQSTDENSSSPDEIVQSSLQPLTRVALQMNGRQQEGILHSLRRPTRSNFDHPSTNQHDIQGQMLFNTFDPEQAVDYFHSHQKSIANTYQNFKDVCLDPTMEQIRSGPSIDSTCQNKQSDPTTNSLISNGTMYRVVPKSNLVISQFDPQDSRQLLELIQQKQFQQMS